MDSLLRDFAYALRTLRKSAGFTLIAVVTIALGIGASAAIFSVVNAVLLQPLPYAAADRLVVVWGDLRARDVRNFPFSPPDFVDLRERVTLLEEVAAVTTGRQAITGDDGEPEQVVGAGVTHNFVAMLGGSVVLGRQLEPADATPVPPPPPEVGFVPPPLGAALISHAFWQRRYGGDTGVIGRSVQVGNQTVEIVGVLAPGFELHFAPGTNIERTPDLFVALRLDFAAASRLNVFLRVVGRLAPGATMSGVQQQLDALAADLARDYPIKAAADWHLRAEPMHEDLVSGVRPAIVALMGAVLFVLLIACANVANLLLVRGAARSRELSVRAALGGSRLRLVRQMLAESLMLASAGAVLGVGLAALGIRLLLLLQPQGLPRVENIAIDPNVIAFTAAASFLAAFIFGLIPALRASRTDIASVLRESGRSAGLAGGSTLRSGVIVVEVALCFILLIGSGLMLRSFAALNRVDPGFDPENVLTFVANARGTQPDERAAWKQQMVERLGALPGVSAVTAANPLPLDGGVANSRWGPPEAADDPELFQQANLHFVLPGYFETLRTRLIAGRSFEIADNVQTSSYVVIDELLARRAFRGGPALGQRLLVRYRSDEPEWMEVIGVVAHQRHESMAEEGRVGMFITDGQIGHGAANRWAVRTTGDPLSLLPRIREEVAALDALVPVADVQPMTALLDRAMSPTRFALALIAVFAAVAATLAGIGLYGVLSTVVRQRTAEIGVRVAFGASPGSIMRLFVGQGLRLSAAGIGIGLLGALALTRTIESLLVGVAPTDPVTFAAMAALFIAIAALASWLPARRAQRLDPTVALRRD
jgi:predicted permease